MKIEKLKVGQTIYDVKKSSWRTGWKWDVWPVKIFGIDLEKQTLFVSWNNNPPRICYSNSWKNYRYTLPKEA